MDKLKKIYSVETFKIYNKTEFDRETVGSEGYGETGYESIDELVEFFREHFNDETVFYDLGSGIGKIVFHIGLKYNLKKACGIEFSKERHSKAEQLKVEYEIDDNVTFINDNILDCDISDATVIYIDNTLFPTKIDSEIYKLIPPNCLVLTRKRIRESKINDELIKNNFSVRTNYGTNTINTFIKN